MQQYPPHINKCYCKNGNFCFCASRKQSIGNSNSPNKFIKVHSHGNKYKSSLFSCGNSTSLSTVPTLLSSISTSSTLHDAPSTDSRLTERRKIYENPQGAYNQPIDLHVFGMPHRHQALPAKLHLFRNDQIAKLQEFRLQNAKECLSSCSRYSIDKQYSPNGLKNDLDHGVDTRYTLNKRGLLRTVDGPVNGKNRETIDCITVLADSKDAAKDILREKLLKSKEREKFLRKALCMPDNSLALRYQKTD